jgi:sulfate adenylyltransferase
MPARAQTPPPPDDPPRYDRLPDGRTPDDPLPDGTRAAELAQASVNWPSVALDADSLADLELLLLGGFGTPPRYADGPNSTTVGTQAPTAMPVLDVDPAEADGLVPGVTVALRDAEGVMVAALRLTSVTAVPSDAVGTAAGAVAGAGADVTARVRLGGPVEAVQLPHHPDYPQLWRTPADVRAELARRVHSTDKTPAAVAVWAEALLHTADVQRIRDLRAAGRLVVVLAAAGGADPANRSHHLRVRCLRAAIDAATQPTHPADAAPLHQIHSPSDASKGCGFDASREGYAVPLVLVPLRPALLTADTGQRIGALYGLPTSVVGPAPDAPDAAALTTLLDEGTALPASITPATVADELARAYPPRHQRGLAVLFTGLSGSGKSTLAKLLTVRLLERGDRDVTLLDGDVVRTHLSKGLGFSRLDRDTNVRRIGFVAAQTAGAGGTVICAPIAPFAAVRAEVRAMVQARGAGFVLIHVAAPLEVCEARDRKGLYAKARAGIIPAFTGVSDPYEVPDDAEVVLDTSVLNPDDAVEVVLDHLRGAGWLAGAKGSPAVDS